jgi:outer membrane protein assembly factor BamB
MTLFLITSCAQVQKYIPLDKIPKQENIFQMNWSKNLDPVHDAGNLPIGTASPLIHEDMVYMGNLSGEMNVYDLETGRLVWSENEAQPINAQVAIHGDSVIYGSKMGRVFSRHYLTGKLNYSIDLGASIESAPVVYAGRMFIHLRNHKIVALDAATGKILWGYKRSIPYSTTLQRVSRALPYKNKIVVGFADGHVGAISIEEGVVVWEQKITNKHKFVDVDVDPIFFNGKIVAGSANGSLSFINPENGIVERTVNITIGHTPVRYKNMLYVGSVFGELAAVDKDGNVKNLQKVASDGITSLIPWKGRMVAATMNGKLLALNLKSFELDDRFELGSDLSSVFGHLQQSAGYLAVYSSRNRLYLFR